MLEHFLRMHGIKMYGRDAINTLNIGLINSMCSLTCYNISIMIRSFYHVALKYIYCFMLKTYLYKRGNVNIFG